MKTVKNQHYVPQFYLKRFTCDGKRLFVFDKIKGEARGPMSIEKVAQERYFYDIPIETLPPGADPQLEEKALAELESMFSQAVKSVFNVIEGKGASLQERMNMSLFVTFQIPIEVAP